MSFKIPILISYWMLSRDKKNVMFDLIEKYKDRFRLVIDSGAYSAFTQKKVIHVEDYCNWVKDVLNERSKRIQIDGYFQLDVIGDQDATKRNLILSEDVGKTKPIPIFTRAKNEKDLDYLNELIVKYKWVGIGAIKGTAKQYTKWLLDRCNNCKQLHLLGFADIDFALYYKPKSFDCSTWCNGSRFGLFYNATTMKGTSDGKKCMTLKESQEYGFQEKDYHVVNDQRFRSSSGLLMNASQASACHAFIRQAMRLEERGTKSYLVCISPPHIEMLHRSYEYFIEKKSINLFSKESRYV